MSKFILNRQFWSFGPNFHKQGNFCPKQIKWTTPLNSALFKFVSMPSFILNRQFWVFWPNIPKRGKKILFIVNNPRIPKFFSYHEIHLLTYEIHLFKKLAHPFDSQEIIFEKSAQFRMTHFDISVALNDAKIIIPVLESSFGFNKKFTIYKMF